MKVAITGADGFVGRHLSTYLESCGDEVLGIDRTSGGDILDSASLERIFRAFQPEVAYHLAGFSDVGGSWQNPLETFRANADGTLNVLQQCTRVGVLRILVVSSADVYGRVTADELPIQEDAPLRPYTPYAASKVAADFLAMQAWLGYGLETIRVRAFNHLGPGQTNKFVAPALAERIASNELDGGELVPVGNLTPRRDFTDVRDVVKAYRLVIEHGVPGDVYNVCSGRDIAISDLAERMVALARTPMRLERDPDLQRPVDTPVLRGDFSKLAEDTGWKPTIDISVTLNDILDEWREHLEWRNLSQDET